MSGFQNPSRSLYTALREAIENSLTACELTKTPPVIQITITQIQDTQQYKIKINDNGPGVDESNLAKAFGRFLTSGYYTYVQSLPYDTPVMVKKGRTPVVMPIGDFIESHVVTEYEAFSYNLRTGKLEWQAILGGVRHASEGDMYQINIEGGAWIRLTGNHHLLTFNKRSGKTTYKSPETMKAGDFLIAPRSDRMPPSVGIELRYWSAGVSKFYEKTRRSQVSGMLGECVPVRIKSIERVAQEPMVYDLSVDKNNNFIGGHLPVVIHNSRSLFGVGIKATLLAGQATTGVPATIISSTDGKTATKITLEIDVNKNEGKTLTKETIKTNKTGLSIEFTIAGDYSRARGKILDYLTQTTIVAPYVEIHYAGPNDDKFDFKPVIKDLPKVPTEMLPHPSGADVETLKTMIHETKPRMPVVRFLKKKFQRMGETLATEILQAALVNPDSPVSSLTTEKIADIVHVMRATKFMAPNSEGLSPVTSETLIAGINYLFKPDWVAAVVRPPSSYSGYPFIVTAAIAYGGSLKSGIQVFRFANRIPLLFDEGNDVSRKVIDSIDWRRYKIDTANDKVAIVVSIVSVKIPFKTAGKEYIADVDEVEGEIRLAIQRLARDLMLHISARHKNEALAKRNEIYNKYIPQALKFISDVAGTQPPKVKK